jgi:Ca-activated chloride channel family protein
MATDAAGNGVGLTVIGVGVGLGSEVFEAMSRLRGGNAFTLMDEEDITDTMAQDWPWMLEPIAYDLNVALTPGAGFSVTAGYGFPSSDTGEPELSLTASSVFLSQKRGALLVQLSPDQDTLALTDLTATGTLSYESPEGETVSQDIAIDTAGLALGEDGRFFEQPSVKECVALALLVDGMKTASEQYGESHEQAIATMEQVVARFEADIATIEDTSPDDVTMDTELQLARRLLQLMRDGAEQGDLYGQASY